MEISSLNAQSGAVASIIPQALAQPQEQQARNLRSERESVESVRTNDQVTLSGASQQVAALGTERVLPQTEVPPAADQQTGSDRVEQARQARTESGQAEPPLSRSVVRALETYSQAAALSN